MLTALFTIAYAVLTLLLLAHASVTLAWMLYTWRSPDADATTGFRTDLRSTAPCRHRFTLLVPARHEEAVLGETLDRLAAMDHPNIEILAIIGHDDDGTRAVADAAAARHPGRVRVVVDHSWPKNKPKALNTALSEATGEIIGIFDAEDEVHPRLLDAVDEQFHDTGIDVVQGGVQLVNFWSNWYSVRNVLEYFFWFRSRLHFHAQAGFIPLGGNTVFVRKWWLDMIGGWDPDSLTEDCDLGVRLSVSGARFSVAYDPTMVTHEETPPTFGGWLKQRTRWNQGFLQVLGKRDWKRLDAPRRRLAWYTLSSPFIQAASGLLIPLAIVTMVLAPFPVWLAILTFLPALPTIATMVVEVIALREVAEVLGRPARLRDHIRLVIGAFPYQVALAVAALRAVWRHSSGETSWEKTDHAGTHRSDGVEEKELARVD